MLQDTDKLPNTDLVDQFQLQNSQDANHCNTSVPAFGIPNVVIWVPGELVAVQIDEVLIPKRLEYPRKATPDSNDPEFGFG